MRICSSCQRCYDDTVEFCTENNHSPLSEPYPGSCEMIAGYRLEFGLRSDLRGDLYRARQVECGRWCRVRVLSAPKKNSQQFLREAKHAAALFHPNLVDVYEAGVVDGKFYVVAEEPDGQTLVEYLNNVGAPPLLNTIEIIERTADALHAFHLEGLLHRAVRPDNIVLSTDQTGRLLVRLKDLDFGSLIERSVISNKFLIDTAMDSVRYFAPEQCTGDKTTVQTDVYSLGIVLYEMLAGAPPFDAPKASGVIEMHRRQQPPEIRIENFDLRMLLTHTLAESLQKSPDRRHSSAQAFARQLRHMEQLATHISTPPPAMAVSQIRSPSAGLSNTVGAPSRFLAVESPHETNAPSTRMEQPEQFPSQIESDLYDPWLFGAACQRVECGNEPAADESIGTALPFVQAVIAQPGPKARLDRASHLSRIRLRKNRSKRDVQLSPTKVPSYEAELPPTSEIPIAFLGQVDSAAHNNLVQMDPDEITAVTARRRASVVEWEQSQDDIPSVESVLEVLSAELITPAFAVDSPGRSNERPSASDSKGIDFFPDAVQGARDSCTIDLYPNYSIMSAYGSTTPRISVDYQTLLLGAGIAALIAVFLGANLMFRGKVPDPVSQSPALIGTETIQSDQPQSAQLSVAKTTPKSIQKQKSDEAGPDPEHPSSAERSRALSDITDQKQSAKTAPVQTTVKTPAIASTLVISTQNGKVRSTIETAKRSNEPRPPVATNKSGMMGRPRIVGNPSQ